MQILFVDESGTPPPRKGTSHVPFFVLGGVIIPEDYWHKIKQELLLVKKKYKVVGEIKWREFAAKPEGHIGPFSHLNTSQKEGLRTDIYGILSRFKSIKLLGVVVDTQKAYQLAYIQNADDLYWYAYKQLAERFQYYLQDISRLSGSHINGIVVCDYRAPKDDVRLRELHERMLSKHHQSYSNYNNLIEGLFIAPSHLSVGIQFADMVAGATLRREKGDNRFFDQIKQLYRASPTGKIEGYGLVRFPK
ncbi:MAG: DUF3800 domain-containing protein [Alphaproteobacteria bacterium]